MAIYHNRRVAAFHTLLHLTSLGGAITLLVLHSSQYWIGQSQPEQITLQFAAKFHEQLTQVSLVEILHCIVRSEAVHGFVPLGALSGAVQATQLSYLWSLDFLATLRSHPNSGREWQNTFMVIAIPTILISTVLVGPSSAVLMIPEPGMPKVGAYFNIPYQR